MNTPDPDDDDPISQDELQYDDGSDDSGSDYVEVPDSEEENLMIGAAIEASHKTARLEAQQRSGAGPSTSRTSTASRITTGVVHIVESDEEPYEDFSPSDDSDNLESSLLGSSDDEPVPKTKGKAKAKSKKGKSKIFTEPLPYIQVVSQHMRRAEQRRLARLERNEVKKEERLLAATLGRRLTWVCLKFADQMMSVQHIF